MESRLAMLARHFDLLWGVLHPCQALLEPFTPLLLYLWSRAMPYGVQNLSSMSLLNGSMVETDDTKSRFIL